MMTTRWSPDTCDCILESDDGWKTAKPVRLCKFHATATDPLAAVHSENAYKNIVQDFAHGTDPNAVAAYSGNALVVNTNPAASIDKTALQKALDTQFGAGIKVL